MKILTNVTREYLGGITTTNHSLLSLLVETKNEVIGLELNARRSMKGPIVFRDLDPERFDHNIINIQDLPLKAVMKTAKNLNDIKKYFRPIISEIKTLMKESAPDIVLINGTYYIPWLVAVAAHELKIPIVLRYHGVYSKETTHFSEKTNRKLSSMERTFHRMAGTIIFPSSLCRQTVEKEVFMKKSGKSFVIPNPVYAPKVKCSNPTQRKIAVVGRWAPIKNFETFFKIHRELAKQNWKHAATLVSAKKKNARVPASITLLSPMRYEGICSFYKSQGLIISPSHFETFGNVPMEAACLGIPVLVSDKMGCAEILIEAGLSNMVIDFSDIKAAANRVKELCGQEILPKQLNNLRKALYPKMINEEILSVLEEAARRKS